MERGKRVTTVFIRKGIAIVEGQAQRRGVGLDQDLGHSHVALQVGSLSSHLELLDAQRSLFSAQQGLIDVPLARFSNQVTVYRVLGCG